MDIGTGDTFQAIYVFVSSLVVKNEEIILESAWGVRMTISNIHAHLLKKVCWTRERFAFVAPFDGGKVCFGKWLFSLGNHLDTCV
jgi:hypothetical protein